MAHHPTMTPAEAARLHAEALEKADTSYNVTVTTVHGQMAFASSSVEDWYASGFSARIQGALTFVNLHNALAVEFEEED